MTKHAQGAPELDQAGVFDSVTAKNPSTLQGREHFVALRLLLNGSPWLKFYSIAHQHWVVFAAHACLGTCPVV